MLIFVDDFIGSGSQALRAWQNRISKLVDLADRIASGFRVYYLALVATQAAQARLRQDTSFTVHAIDVVDERHKAFSSESLVFPASEREEAMQVFKEYGAQLEPTTPLGFGDGQLLLGFGVTTPNNTLPVFWATKRTTGEPWYPLFGLRR